MVDIIHEVRCPSIDCSSLRVAMAGELEHIWPPPKWNPRKERAEEWVERLVAIEEYFNPKRVGGPIDVLRLDKTGYTWIKNQNGCISK